MRHSISIGIHRLLLMGTMLLASCRPNRSVDAPQAPAVPEAVAYINADATAPALPFYALPEEIAPLPFRLEFRSWDSPVLLNSLLLSGKGDFWLASVEILARARAHGAPLQLLAVTGWRKFHLLSSRENDVFPQDFAGRTLPYAPPGSPGKDLLAASLDASGQAQPLWLPQESRQLMFKLLDGQFDCALLPEPLATLLEIRAPHFRRLFAEEEYLSGQSGASARLPWAAVAVNCDFAQAHPEATAALAEALTSEAARLSAMPPEESATRLLAPSGFPLEALANSLRHDLILALPAGDVQEELKSFLSRIAPDLTWDDTLCWKAPGAATRKE